MKKYIIPIILLLVSIKTSGQTGNFNYTYQTKTIYNEALQSSSTDLTKTNQSISYLTSEGKVLETKILNYAPNGEALIQLTIYDEYGRISKNYLPYTDNTDLNFDLNATQNQASFYQNTPLVAHDNHPYTSLEYDQSSSNFVRSGKSVGDFWQDAANPNNKISAQKVNNLAYDAGVGIFGNAYAIRKWDAAISNGYYVPNELIGYVSSSPEHPTEIAFNDKFGRLICKKTFNLSENKLLTTYYIYNDLGQLTYVIPPKAYYKLELLGIFDINLLAEDLIYNYIYDEKGRVIEKKTPGKEKLEVVYDNLDRIILQQDGNLRAQNKWLFYRYDALSRMVISGVYTNTDVPSRLGMQVLASAHYVLNNPNSEIRSGINYATMMGYSNQSFPTLINNPTTGYEILEVYYYDDYDFNADGTDDVNYIQVQFSQFHSPAFNNKNRLTGAKSKVLGTANYLSENYFYQFNSGELIQSHGISFLGGQDITSYEYNFLGQPIRIEQHKNYGGNGYRFIKNRYTYDNQNRLIKSYEKLGVDPEIVLSENAYNHLGQPILKKLHAQNDNGSYLQNINYQYHINGGITKINNPITLGILDPVELITTFSSNGIVDIVSETDPNFLGNVDVAKYITHVELGSYQFMLKEYFVRGGGKYLDVNYTENKRFTINTDVTLPNHETAIVTSTETYGEKLLTYVAESILYADLSGLQGITFNITYSPSVSDFTGNSFYDETKNQIATQLATYDITDPVTITYLTDKAVEKLVASAQKFYQLNTENDMFAMDIIYDTPQFANAIAKHNGNISEVHWKSKSDEVYRGFSYKYDDIEQLTDANYGAYNSGDSQWNNELSRYTVNNITHDYNGNIETLNRKGYRDDGSFGDIDLLSYSYTGNQLITVDDAYNATAVTTDFEDNGSVGVTEFTYDANGNIIADNNKGITVAYNVLNLPEAVTFTDGKRLRFTYSAGGTLLEKKIFQGKLLLAIYQYDGRFLYENSILASIITAEGRAVPDISNGNEFRYEYNYKDQVGNVRLTFSDLNGNGIIKKEEIIQETHYYPFGGKLNGLNTVQIGPENQFKFNGNELHSDNGFNWYNFNARFYMPELGRFANIDPLAEIPTQISLSPYQFSWNNPIALNDPTGLSPDDPDGGRDDGQEGGYDGPEGRRRTPKRDYSWGCIECVQEERDRDYLDFERELIDIGREESIDLNGTFDQYQNGEQVTPGVNSNLYKTENSSFHQSEKAYIFAEGVGLSGSYAVKGGVSYRQTSSGTRVTIGASGLTAASLAGQVEFKGSVSLKVDGNIVYIHPFKKGLASIYEANWDPLGTTSFILPRQAKSVSLIINVTYSVTISGQNFAPSSVLSKEINIPIIIPYNPINFKFDD